MKLVLSVSKKHNSIWRVYGYDYNEDDNLVLVTKKINPLLIWYYKLRKRQRTKAVCSNCSKQFLILSCWYDKIKDAKCPYCLEEDFDEYDD